MIYSIVICIFSLLLFLLFPVHSFYITNGAILEECSDSTMTYLDRFDSTKLHCLNSAWRQTFIFLQYSCIRNIFTRIWTIKTSTRTSVPWPQSISLMTGKEYTYFDKTYLKDDPTIEENSKTFDPNFNQLTTYLWTSLTDGPRCRMKYTIMKDICTANIAPPGARLTELICYYGKQQLNLQNTNEQQRFDKLLEDRRRSGSTVVVTNHPSNGVNQNNSHSIPNQFPSDPNLSSLKNQKNSFLQKNKTFLVIAGIVFVLIILAIIGFIIMRSSGENLEENSTSELNIE